MTNPNPTVVTTVVTPENPEPSNPSPAPALAVVNASPEQLEQAEKLGRLTSENDSLRRELETERNKPARVVEIQVPAPEPEPEEPEEEEPEGSSPAQIVDVPPEENAGGDAPAAPAPKPVNRGLLARLFLGT